MGLLNRYLVQKNLFSVLLYISFFPQLIAGPIVRYEDIADQLRNRELSVDRVSRSLHRFILGLGKKVLIANQMGFLADTVFGFSAGDLGMGSAWIGAVCYTLQIFFDFSGYSDMAIGLGCVFGFDFKENFNYPFIAPNIQNFWRRWNISLSTWFKEYVYIPLGGSRRGKVRTTVNKLLVFFLTGLWHGANFIENRRIPYECKKHEDSLRHSGCSAVAACRLHAGEFRTAEGAQFSEAAS